MGLNKQDYLLVFWNGLKSFFRKFFREWVRMERMRRSRRRRKVAINNARKNSQTFQIQDVKKISFSLIKKATAGIKISNNNFQNTLRSTLVSTSEAIHKT
jgi:hypothetical protein